MTVAPPDPEVLQRLARRIDVEQLARRLFDTARQIPGYREFIDADPRIYDLFRWNIELFMRWVGDGRRPTEADLDVLREVVRNRAADGMPAATLLLPYQAGLRAGWQMLLETADDDETPHVLHAADLFFEHSDLLVTTIVTAYSDERETLASEDERRARTLIESLIAGRELTPEDRLIADRLGFAIAPSYVPFVAALPGQPARRHAELATRLRAEGALTASEGTRVVGLALRVLPFATFGLGDALLHAQGNPTNRGALTEALADLRHLAAIAARHERTGAVETGDHLPELLLERSPAIKDQVTARVFAPLETSTDLKATLTALVAHEFDRGATAAALHVHRNTLSYRIGRIEELTGLDLDGSEGRALAWLAVCAGAQ